METVIPSSERWSEDNRFFSIQANTEDDPNTLNHPHVSITQGSHLTMREVHILNELRSEPGWAFLCAAFLVGVVVFALMRVSVTD